MLKLVSIAFRFVARTAAYVPQPSTCLHGSRVCVDNLSRFFTVEATEKECAALAERFSCEKITGVKADLRVVRAAGSESRKIKIRVSEKN